MHQVRFVSPLELKKWVANKPADLLDCLRNDQIIIAKNYYPRSEILQLRNRAFQWGQDCPASWHPLQGDLPDFHQLQNDHPQSVVKSKMHVFFYHGWHEENNKLFDYFSDVFWLKAKVGGYPENSFLKQTPKEGVVSRVYIRHYPQGGGYLGEHFDHVAKFSLFQAVIPAFDFGKDFKTGGLYLRDKNKTVEFFDHEMSAGDLVLLSTTDGHGVSPIDPEFEYDWKRNTGRWSIVPLIIETNDNLNRIPAKPAIP